MQRHGLINLLLLTVVLLLGLLVWLSPEPGSEKPRQILTGLDPAAIQQIEIVRPNSVRLVLEKTPDGWRMRTPHTVAADRQKIDRLLELLTTPWSERLDLPTERLAEFGLQPPLAELRFNDTRIDFGATHPLNHQRYLRIGPLLYLTKDRFPHLVLSPAEDFVNRQLLPANRSVTAIKTPDWHLIQEQGQWRLEPDNGATPAQLQEKVAAWQRAVASKVMVAADTPPTGTVRITFAGGEPPLSLGLIRQTQRPLLVRPELGLAYRLSDEQLLSAPRPGD